MGNKPLSHCHKEVFPEVCKAFFEQDFQEILRSGDVSIGLANKILKGGERLLEILPVLTPKILATMKKKLPELYENDNEKIKAALDQLRQLKEKKAAKVAKHQAAYKIIVTQPGPCYGNEI